MTTKRPCLLLILDGWGIGSEDETNAIFLARTPNLDRLMENYPATQLVCSGEAVGLPEGIMGNSEVGHLNIGAGRIVYQDLLRIDKSIQDRSFFNNRVFSNLFSKIKSNHSSLHLMGLVSDGGVHSQLKHLLAFLKMAKEKKLEQVFVHVILDGRDTPPDSGIEYTKTLSAHMQKMGIGTIATICGRFYAMDRDTRWERTEKAYRLYSQGKGISEKNPVSAIDNAYQRGETDEFVSPVVISDKQNNPLGLIRDQDGVVFFNFRADRARQITRAFTDMEFKEFNRNPYPKLCDFVCMTLYDELFDLPVAFPPVHLENILGEVISRHHLKQLRIAETEKYAHVTYFFNGGEETSFPLEDRCLIPSPREVSTYDQKPEMSAPEVTREVVSRIKSDEYDFIVLNFANMDMVGHTGIMEAAIKACETLDICVQEIVTTVLAQKGTIFITADHGNAEKMVDGNNHFTAHTLNTVPFIMVADNHHKTRLRQGVLGDIAPTILAVLGIDPPREMTGTSLIIK